MKAIVEGKQVEMTDWFPPHIKPVRPGWYHTGFEDEEPVKTRNQSEYCWYWNGIHWCDDKNQIMSKYQNRWWRGLTKPFDQS